MTDNFVIVVEGLDGADLEAVTPQITRAARLAINRTSDRARTQSAREIRRQIHFPAGYLQGAKSRLTVSKRATDTDLEAVVTGRRRPTSLARFVSGPTASRGGVRVQVKPGATRLIPKAFLMRLRSGDDGTLGNMGLAVRTERGKTPRGAYKPLKLAEGLWLLYGPSVDQVFRSVREDVSPEASRFLADEFTRLLDLKL